jgi:dipeptidyl aminopeptidase/acylaminoacyl peptidase
VERTRPLAPAAARSLCSPDTLRIAWLTAAIAIAIGVAAPPARSTFPGPNGQLAYEQTVSFDTRPAIFSTYPFEPERLETRLTSSAVKSGDPAWTADGERLAFMSDRDGDPEIYVMNRDGTGQTRLTANPAWDLDPTWSPDGSRIAFTSTRDGNPEIYVMNADGTGQSRLTVDPAIDQQADWSPTGSRIAFESTRDGNFELYAMNQDGSGQTRLTFSPGGSQEASWSPDGGAIAYTEGPQGRSEIRILGTSGGPVRTLRTRFFDQHFPAWSPDGRQIAYSVGQSTYVQEVDGDPASAELVASGLDAAWAPLPPPKPVPRVAETLNVEPAGDIFVRVKGSAAASPLRDAREVPIGSVIDTREGSVQLESASGGRSTYLATVSEGRATLLQTGGRTPDTTLRLPRLKKRCARSGGGLRVRLRTRTLPGQHAQASRHRRGKIGHTGDYGRGAASQTDWTTINTCRSTVFRVHDGVVEVTDFTLGQTVRVRGPRGRYVARAPRR